MPIAFLCIFVHSSCLSARMLLQSILLAIDVVLSTFSLVCRSFPVVLSFFYFVCYMVVNTARCGRIKLAYTYDRDLHFHLYVQVFSRARPPYHFYTSFGDIIAWHFAFIFF